MKQKILVLCVLAALPLAAVCLHIVTSKSEKKISSAAPQAAAKPASSLSKKAALRSPGLAADGSLIKQPSPEGLAAKQRSDESKTRAAKSFQKLADLMTPEFRARAAQSIMQRRQHSYDKLFTSWNLDAGKSREVVGILYEREVRRMANLANFAQDAYGRTSAKAKASKDMTEDLVARQTLELCIGEPRTTELLELIRKAEEGEMANAARQK